MSSPLLAALRESPLSPIEKAAHALSRFGYGPRPGEVLRLADRGDAAIAELIEARLSPPPRPTPPGDRFAILELPPEKLTKAFPEHQPGEMFDISAVGAPREILEGLILSRLDRAIQGPSERQLAELLGELWFDHFNVDWKKGAAKWLVADYERNAIWPHLFGRFRELLGAVAHHPAMLFYLDNWLSTKDGFEPKNPGKQGAKAPRGLNENYARELLELHTLGVDGGYTQADVIAVARAFTGWTIDHPRKGGLPMFRARAHDQGEKTILGVPFPSGHGEDEGERVLDLLAKHQATAGHLARFLCQRFVSDAPSPELVARVAGLYLKTDGDLRSLYFSIASAPELWSRPAFRAKVKTPYVAVVSAVRASGVALDPGERAIGKRLEPMGQLPYSCQPPTGYPDLAAAWVNPGSLVARIRFALDLVGNRIPGATMDSTPWAQVAGQGSSAERLDRLAAAVLGLRLEESTSRAILGEAKDDDDPGRLLGLILGSPDFQRR